jgi:SAM-dependent methyltransferase
MAGKEVWEKGDAYEQYVGRWSRLVARDFLDWLDPAVGQSWLDVGCGTGALCAAIIEHCAPTALVGIDRLPGFLATARARIADPRARFEQGDAQALPPEGGAFDVAVSGLVLNFVGNPGAMLGEMRRALRPGGTVALYVWDYAEKMQLMRYFWDAAADLDPSARELDEGGVSRSAGRRRWPRCFAMPVSRRSLPPRSTSRRCSGISRTTGPRSSGARVRRPAIA